MLIKRMIAAKNREPLPLPEFIFLMALLTSLVAFSIDAVLPALNQIGAELGASSPQHSYLVISLFFAGMAFGQLFFGPFSDARGRRLTILVGLAIFILGTLICYYASSMEMMLFGRLVQAFGVSGPRIASMALIRDLYVGDAMARVMSFIMVVFILVPMIAPLIGQGVMLMAGWRHIFTLFLLVTLLSGIWFFSRQSETLPRDKRKPFTWHQFFVGCIGLFKNKVVMGYSLALGFIFGAFLGYLSASQTVFQVIYDTGEYFPLLFALLAFSIGLASLCNGMLVMRLGMQRLTFLALIGTVIFSFVLSGLVWHFDGVPPLFVFVSVMFIGFFCIGVLFGNLNAMAMAPLGHIAGLGAAFIGSFTSFIAVPIASFIANFINASLLPIALGFLLFSSLAFLAVEYGNRHQ